MPHPPRLKTPQGQRSTAPQSDEKLRSLGHKSPVPDPEPAELLYSAFRASVTQQGKRPPKPWHELASCERTGWRASYHYLRSIWATGVGVFVPQPPAEGLVLVAAREGVFASKIIDRTVLVRSKLAADVKELDAEVTRRASDLRSPIVEVTSS